MGICVGGWNSETVLCCGGGSTSCFSLGLIIVKILVLRGLVDGIERTGSSLDPEETGDVCFRNVLHRNHWPKPLQRDWAAIPVAAPAPSTHGGWVSFLACALSLKAKEWTNQKESTP